MDDDEALPLHRNFGQKKAPDASLRDVRRLCLQYSQPVGGGGKHSALWTGWILCYCTTVTARRFCDQHEMSSHSATGRSLPNDFIVSRFEATPLLMR